MRILSLSLKNHYWGWDFEETDFSSNLMLLVGISGAGKTQILKGILDLKDIANGQISQAVNGLEWKIKFLTNNNNECIWEGCFESVEQIKDPHFLDHYMFLKKNI